VLDCRAGEIKGRTINVLDDSPVGGSTVIIEQQPTYSQNQSSRNDGGFSFTGIPSGKVFLRGHREGFSFAVEELSVSRQDARTVDLMALPLTHGPDEKLMSWFKREVEHFSDNRVGYAATWARLSRFTISPHAKVGFSKAVVKHDPVARVVPAIGGYADSKNLSEAFEGLDLFVRDVDVKYPFGELKDFNPSVVCDIAASILVLAKKPEKEKLFLAGYGEQFGRAQRDNANRVLTTQRQIQNLRHSTWKTKRQEGNRTLATTVELSGDSGTLTEGNQIPLQRIAYFQHEGKPVIAGNMKLGDESNWFTFKVSEGGEAFTGEWGSGEVIGGGPRKGDWSGERVRPD